MPIACTLTATQMADRRAEMAAIGRAALLGADEDDALALTIGAPPEARPVRDELVAAFGA